MSDIHDVMDVTMDDLSPEQQVQLKDAIDQFQQKCLYHLAKTEVVCRILNLTCQGFYYQGNLTPRLPRRNKKL
jgi:hypothetical protein